MTPLAAGPVSGAGREDRAHEPLVASSTAASAPRISTVLSSSRCATWIEPGPNRYGVPHAGQRRDVGGERHHRRRIARHRAQPHRRHLDAALQRRAAVAPALQPRPHVVRVGHQPRHEPRFGARRHHVVRDAAGQTPDVDRRLAEQRVARQRQRRPARRAAARALASPTGRGAGYAECAASPVVRTTTRSAPLVPSARVLSVGSPLTSARLRKPFAQRPVVRRVRAVVRRLLADDEQQRHRRRRPRAAARPRTPSPRRSPWRRRRRGRRGVRRRAAGG